MKLAIFDFDGTIYKKETFTLLMNHLKTTYPKRYRRFFISILPVYIGYKLKLIAERKMKAFLMKRYLHSLEGFSTQETNDYFADVSRKMIKDCHQEIIQRLKDHKKAGFYTMILSGAFTPLLTAFNRDLLLNADAIIGTTIPETPDQFVHIHAEQKVLILKQYFRDKEVDWKASYAYGDSAADLPVLHLVGHPVAVSPDQALAHEAKVHGWNVVK